MTGHVRVKGRLRQHIICL